MFFRKETRKPNEIGCSDGGVLDIPDASANQHEEEDPSGSKDGGNERILISKILIAVSFSTVISMGEELGSPNVVILFEGLAIILMGIGMFLEVGLPMFSRILQRLGRISCLVGVILMQAPVLQLPSTCAWLPPFAIAVVLASAEYVTGEYFRDNRMSSSTYSG